MTVTVSCPALAEFPEQPIRIVVSALPGGSPDILARIIGQHLSLKIGQSVIVENKSGGAGAIANEYVARAKPDGYTLLGTSDALGINVSFFPDQPDPTTSFTPVIQAMSSPQVLAVRSDIDVKSVDEYVERAKTDPGGQTISVPGVTTSGNLASLMLESQTGIDLNIAVYPSAAPAINDVLGQHIDSIFVTLGPALPQIQAGKLRAIAVTTPERTPALPDVPTFRELGLDGMTFTSWQGYFAPAGTPPEVVSKLNSAINEVLAEPEVQKQLLANAFDPAGGTPEQQGALLHDGIGFWADIVKKNNVKLEN
ncbi:tripartite tricarboxylate transporter substrate binding protein [Neorhizobium sp. T786]|uniref:Bug family tripartite tricarboxylate transporter substrate binding protein n=1 Tax=Pseudorhizobium xiangyangii TaxID=2883104 RepID=UPI001D000B1D|nr:tripartite tricarboxylate transporter substrate binding protein [Neorhizobium xiangyangii]MCB5201173.1 tripartite tricarboxylate transporter substrate binding protein [Neorhizobium xiangyangii]